jgi:hypothetical protein
VEIVERRLGGQQEAPPDLGSNLCQGNFELEVLRHECLRVELHFGGGGLSIPFARNCSEKSRAAENLELPGQNPSSEGHNSRSFSKRILVVGGFYVMNS